MAGPLTHADGRLRTGRVSLLIFIGLLGAMCLLFKANRSMDHAILAVKHLFEPAAAKSETQRFEIKQETEAEETLWSRTIEKSPATERETSPQTVARVRERTALADTVAERDAPSRPGKVPEPDVTRKVQQPPPPKPVQNGDKTRVPDAPVTVSKDRQTERPYTAVEKETPPHAGDRQGDIAQKARAPLLDREVLQKLARIGAEASSVKTDPIAQQAGGSEKLKRLRDGEISTDMKSPSRSYPAAEPIRKTGYVQADSGKGVVTVDQKSYMHLFQSWRAAGDRGKAKEKIPLRVQDLRHTYELFQMKVIAVVRGNTFLDLTDGTRVAEASLGEYSSTLFRVDRPWSKWGEALAAAGVQRNEQVEVRYYMYDFIKEAIYARVHQAFSWCKNKGLIETDVRGSDVDVLGRAYGIHRQGGGRFGVFVPTSLNTPDGQRIAIDPACFRGQADVETLRGAGLL